MLKMVLEFKGYDPSEVGLRKFLTIQETEVLGCLWELGKEGGDANVIQRRLGAQDCNHSLATVDKTLTGLKNMGVISNKNVAHNKPNLVYYPLIDRDKLPAFFVDGLVSTLNEAMPEAMAHAVKKLKP
jgi:predicted transcriptional regulator